MIDDQSEGLVVYIQDSLYFCVVMYSLFSMLEYNVFPTLEYGSQFEDAVPFEWAHTKSGEKIISHWVLVQFNYGVEVPLAREFELTCG